MATKSETTYIKTLEAENDRLEKLNTALQQQVSHVMRDKIYAQELEHVIKRFVMSFHNMPESEVSRLEQEIDYIKRKIYEQERS